MSKDNVESAIDSLLEQRELTEQETRTFWKLLGGAAFILKHLDRDPQAVGKMRRNIEDWVLQYNQFAF